MINPASIISPVSTTASKRCADGWMRQAQRSIVQAITHVSPERATELLQLSAGEVKTAIVVELIQVTPEQARLRLQQADGHLRTALEG